MKNLPLNLKEHIAEFPAWFASAPVDQLASIAQQIHEEDGQLLTLWGSDERFQGKGFYLHLAFVYWQQGILHLQCDLPAHNPLYPDLSAIFPVANRLQRALFDLLGIQAVGKELDQRPWLRHGAWSSDTFPLREDVKLTDHFVQENDHYSFVRVSGEGVHEIPVGPVHAGIIEPGHFRFSVVGERILRLEERLGYTHKGIAKHFQHCTFSKGAQLAGRISGDSTVAYAWAYSMAVENLYQQNITSRALLLRALLLERERIMNHLGDLGALGNDAGLSFALSQFSRLKEKVLRLNATLFGYRYLMDCIVPGGVAIDLSLTGQADIQQEIQTLRNEINILRTIYAEHEGLQDRFVSTGIVGNELAKHLGIFGLAARASGIATDWRVQFPYAPFKELNVRMSTEKAGDVAARVSVRFKEIDESLLLIDHILEKLQPGSVQQQLPEKIVSHVGMGCVEGWRGPVFVAVYHEHEKQMRWVHVHDPSWQNWPALEHAVLGNIVPDFPLINKSFNLSYSGHDG